MDYTTIHKNLVEAYEYLNQNGHIRDTYKHFWKAQLNNARRLAEKEQNPSIITLEERLADIKKRHEEKLADRRANISSVLEAVTKQKS